MLYYYNVRKVITNTELAELLRDIAAAYKIKGEKKNTTA